MVNFTNNNLVFINLVLFIFSVIPPSQSSKKPEFTKGVIIVYYYGYCCHGYNIQNYSIDTGV